MKKGADEAPLVYFALIFIIGRTVSIMVAVSLIASIITFLSLYAIGDSSKVDWQIEEEYIPFISFSNSFISRVFSALFLASTLPAPCGAEQFQSILLLPSQISIPSRILNGIIIFSPLYERIAPFRIIQSVVSIKLCMEYIESTE